VETWVTALCPGSTRTNPIGRYRVQAGSRGTVEWPSKLHTLENHPGRAARSGIVEYGVWPVGETDDSLHEKGDVNIRAGSCVETWVTALCPGSTRTNPIGRYRVQAGSRGTVGGTPIARKPLIQMRTPRFFPYVIYFGQAQIF